MRSRSGFTLIELVILLLIVGIIAALSIPRFIDLQKNAVESQEKAIIGALREASYHYLLDNDGVAYDGNPFEVLEIAPPNAWGTGDSDGITWTVVEDAPENLLVICCPHYAPPLGGPGKGCLWRYVKYGTAEFDGHTYSAGAIYQTHDLGH